MNSKRPIARIDYLHTDGSIGESCHFHTESEFLARVKEDNYGTSGFMTEREVKEVLDLTPDLHKHTGTVLGLLDGQFVCVPKETRLNANKTIAVWGSPNSERISWQRFSGILI